MATGGYVGNNGVAKKLVGGYVGVNSLARKIIKGYVGINGVASLCWLLNRVEKKSQLLNLSVARANMSGGSIGNYALFAGGTSNATGSQNKNTVDAYDTSLVRSTPTALSNNCYASGSANVGDYLLFAGGAQYSGNVSTVNTYTANLTKSTTTSLSNTSASAGCTTTDYAIFALNYSYANAYNSSLTRTVNPSLSISSGGRAYTSFDNKALYAGGWTNRATSNVDVVNNSLVRTSPTSLSSNLTNGAGAATDDYAIVLTNYSTTADVYDTNLTKTTLTISPQRNAMVGASYPDFVIFGGGFNQKSVFMLDKNLVQTSLDDFNANGGRVQKAKVGNYILFGGRVNSDSTTTTDTSIDVYEINY